MGLRKESLILGVLGFIILDGLLLCSANANVHYYNFVLEEANFTRLCTSKSMLTVNGSFPGPTIQVRKGDKVYVNVRNQGNYGVTIHWHGVKQPRNPWSDGPENITQCPIQPGNSFTYEIILSNEEGTLWWHAHSDWSRATVHGAFVILPAIGTTYPFPTPHAQQTLILGSWFKEDVKALIDQALAVGDAPAPSNSHTINGEPGDLLPCSTATTFRMSAEYGKTYLLRIINAVMNEEQFFAIANHTLTVVGQDGAYIKPIKTNYIMITPGQTMDILVTANQAPNYYYIAASPFFDSVVPFDSTIATAILQYKGNFSPPSAIPFPTLPSVSDETAANNFTSRLRRLATKNHPINVPKSINEHLYVTIALNQIPCPANQTCLGPNNNIISASLNNVSFETPRIDILEAYYRGLNGVFTKDFPSLPPSFFDFAGVTNISVFTARGTKAKVLNYMDAVEMVFQGTNIGAAENHPMHIHGYSFYVVGSGSGNFNNVTDPKSYNLIDPPEVNTVGVPKNGWVAIRFFADNPGVWFIHCHLERHASWGMDTVLIVKNGKTEATSLLPRPSSMPPCSA